jgi:carbohydrate diacid regulator
VSKTFEQVAQILAKKLSSILQTEVFISDSKKNVVASRTGKAYLSVGRNSSNLAGLNGNCLSLPLQIQDQVGEVKIFQTTEGETLSFKHAQAFIELVLGQVSTPAFLDQQIYKNQIITDLLHGRIRDEATALEQASVLGIDFSPPRAVILIDATEYVFALNQRVDPYHNPLQRSQIIIDNIVAFFNLPDETICADLGGGQLAVLKASDSKNLNPWAIGGVFPGDGNNSSWTNLDALKRASHALLLQLREQTGTALSVGIGRYHPGLLGLSSSYRDARVALRLGRQFNGQNHVYCLDDLGIAAFACVADERTKIELALHLLSPLDNESELIHTLKVFFAENCALTTTAKQLCIHRNTLTYRLEKISSLTGLDPRRFDEAVQIRLALLLQEFQEEPEHNCQ